jgi:hypothetical protein
MRAPPDALADRDAHRAAHELEIEAGDHSRHVADRAMRDHDRVLARHAPFLGLRVLQAVRIALAVAEAERVDRHLGRLDRVEGAAVEQIGEPLLGADPHVVAAMGADMEVRRELAVEDHLPAGWALHPEVLGDFARG